MCLQCYLMSERFFDTEVFVITIFIVIYRFCAVLGVSQTQLFQLRFELFLCIIVCHPTHLSSRGCVLDVSGNGENADRRSG